MITTYAIMALIAMVLLVGYCALVRKKEPWLLLLFICVTVVNAGYFLLSVSKTVEFAIFANDLAYLGSVFLSMSMLLTIIKLCGFEIRKKLVILLTAIGAVMFLIVATSGILPWYYNAADFDTLQVVYIDDEGNVTPCKTRVNADGTVTFVTDHFSYNAIIGIPASSPMV